MSHSFVPSNVHSQGVPELPAQHDQLRAVLDNLPDGVARMDRELRYVYVNPFLVEATGISAESFIGKTNTEVGIPSHISALYDNALKNVFFTGEEQSVEVEYPSPHGTRSFLSRLIPEKNESGEFANVLLLTRDVTERRAAQHDSNFKSRLLDAVDQAVIATDLSGRITYWNRFAEQLYGWAADEVLGKSIIDVTPTPGSRVEATEIMNRMIQGESWSGEFVVRHRDGHSFPASVTDSPIFNQKGELIGIIGISSDITEKKQAEQERERLLKRVERERARLAYLFTNSPSFAAVLRGPQHVFELANPAYLKLIGGRHVIGKPAREALPEVEGQGYFELLDRVFQTGEPHLGKEMSVFVRTRPADELEELFLDSVYQPIFEADGSVGGIFVHGVNITDHVRARREVEASSRLKDEFLATLSHELRTPLTAIVGWVKLLRTANLDPATQAHGLEVIERNANVQQLLVADILDVSRIITGQSLLRVRAADLARIVHAAIDAVRPALEAKGINLSVHLEEESIPVLGDPGRLQQVFWNLLSNAIKFTPRGGSIEVRVERSLTNARISITDTGIGISRQFLPHVFDRFRQADQSITRIHGGLGLGLAVVKHLIELHGGTVSAYSEGEGYGARFVVELPLADQSPEVASHLDRQENREVARDRGREVDLSEKRILIAEDQPDALELITFILRHAGAKVFAASSAPEALDILKSTDVDLIVADIGMPGEDGYTLLKKIRALAAEKGVEIPAIALTAYAGKEDIKRSEAAGFQRHVSKPVQPETLIATVAEVLKIGGQGPVK
jgi:PAS domain S-box-containing protein